MDDTQPRSTLDARILGADVTFLEQPFCTPMVLSRGTITHCTEARAKVAVRVAEHEAIGHGSIYLSDVWAWPDPSLTHDQRDQVLRQWCRQIAHHLANLCGDTPAHPLELGLRLHEQVCQGARNLQEFATPQPPKLARAMCLSPFDAAIHDAVGQALQQSAFHFYADDVPILSADRLFDSGSTCAAIRRMLRQEPIQAFPAWLAVNKNDRLDEDVAPWIRDRGYHFLKLKLTGQDQRKDAARTSEVFCAARDWSIRDVRLSVDSNEGNRDASSVVDYLETLHLEDRHAFAALQYLEQPTSRDILEHRHDWSSVTCLKPVLLDEGLTSLDLLPEAAAQHWSGLALKTCKGHSFALVAAAWAKQHGLLLALQDLTNPGLAAIHAALFAAFVPTVNGVELNSPQFTPAANDQWLPRLASLLEPRDGYHRLPKAIPPGLGSNL